MTSYDFAHDNDYKLSDDSRIEELLALFDMHNLMPELSKNEHVYATSLAMLVTSLHWTGNSRHLFEALPFAKDRDIDLLDIINTMANLGYDSHSMEIDLADVDERLMPCLFISDKKNGSPLVLLSKQGDLVTAFHSRDRKEITFRAKSTHGEVFFFEKMNQEIIEDDKETKKSAGLSWFDGVFQKFRPVVNEIILTSFMINVFGLAMPLFIMSIYDKVIGTGSTFTLVNLVVGVFIAITAEAALRVVRLKSVVWLGVRLDNIVSNAIFERLLMMKASYTEGASISAQISRIRTFESIRKFFTGPLFSVIIELPFTLVLMFVIWLIAGKLVYVPIMVMLLFVLLLFYYRSRLKVAMRTAARASSKRQQLGMETFLKMHSLHQSGMARNWWVRYKDKLSKSAISSFKTNMVSSTIESAAHAISIFSGVAVITFGVQSIWNNEITIGALVATMILIWRILGPLQTLCSMLPRVESLKVSVDQINRLMSIDIERKNTVIKKPIEHMDGDVNLSNLGLRYSLEVEPIFVGLEIESKAGQIIAVTGPNGAGKSSVLKLINGLYKPQTGTIHIDNMNIKQLDPIELRNYINYLPQNPSLFEGSIKDNLLLVNPLASDEDIIQALKDANAYDEIQLLPNGVDTLVSGIDSNIPAGLIFSINLARVFLKKSKSNIMLLDEMPNAILNGPVGDSYKSLLENNKKKKTIFFVSQRDDFIQFADKVIVLKPGSRPDVMTSKKFIEKYKYD